MIAMLAVREWTEARLEPKYIGRQQTEATKQTEEMVPDQNSEA